MIYKHQSLAEWLTYSAYTAANNHDAFMYCQCHCKHHKMTRNQLLVEKTQWLQDQAETSCTQIMHIMIFSIECSLTRTE